MTFQTPLTLAQDASASNPVAGPSVLLERVVERRLDILNHPQELIEALTGIGLVWAAIFIVIGAMCVLNGYRWHKVVILVLSILAGIAAGLMLGPRIGTGEMITAVSLAVLFALFGCRMMRYTVAVFAGLAGAFFGANAWTALGQDPQMHYVGSIIGLLVLGMLAFITFRFVIIAFTAIGGAALLVLGSLAAMLLLDTWQGGIVQSLNERPLIVPVVTCVAAVAGIVIQQGGGLSRMLSSADAPAKQPAKPATT